jgi:methylmalonyl-CoA mutase
MTDFPDFTKLDLGTPHAKAVAPKTGEAWETPEGVEVKTAYTEADRSGLDFLDDYPGLAPYLRGPYPTMYVTQPWTVRQYAGFSTAKTPTLSTGATWPPARKGCRSPSIWPPTAATTPTIRA